MEPPVYANCGCKKISAYCSYVICWGIGQWNRVAFHMHGRQFCPRLE